VGIAEVVDVGCVSRMPTDVVKAKQGDLRVVGGEAAGSHSDARLLPVVLLHTISSDLSDTVRQSSHTL
jgi:hypothetical protein